MIAVYMVFINNGFKGIKYFQHKENAESFAKEVNEKVVKEYATVHEYSIINFDDPLPVEEW